MTNELTETKPGDLLDPQLSRELSELRNIARSAAAIRADREEIWAILRYKVGVYFADSIRWKVNNPNEPVAESPSEKMFFSAVRELRQWSEKLEKQLDESETAADVLMRAYHDTDR